MSNSLDPHNQEILQQLLWAVTMSEPRTLTLLFVECDSLALRSHLVAQFKAQCSCSVTEITLPPGAIAPYQHIRGAVSRQGQEPEALFIYGLEAVNNPELVFKSLNHTRDAFAQHLRCPVVFWLTSDTLKIQARIAKDWDSWGNTIAFWVDPREQRDWLLDMSDRAFALGLASGGTPYRSALKALVGDFRNFERAWQRVQGDGLGIEPGAEARILLILGLFNPDHRAKPGLYEASLQRWQDCEPTPLHQAHQAFTAFCAGMWWIGAANYNQMDRDQAYGEARQLWEGAIALWTAAGRGDCVARFINPLGEIYYKLGDWEALAATLAEAQTLHASYPDVIWEAHDQGVLAAALAVQRQDWPEVVRLTTAALQGLDAAPPDYPALGWAQRLHGGWYRLHRAIALWHQGDQGGAIADLTTARDRTRIKSDPYLYFEILQTLRNYHFSRQEYLLAFEVKQYQQQVEFEFHFRAFVGAGRLPLHRQFSSEQATVDQPKNLISEAINASGREEDIQHLVKRIKESRYRLTILYGLSGVGKSSLLQAALLPRLSQETMAEFHILPVLQRVYTDWQRSLVQAMGQAFDDLPFPSEHLFHEDSPVTVDPTLAGVLNQLRVNEGNNLLTVLVFDQFEEFIIAHSHLRERLPFYQFLREAMNIPKVKVIIGMRSDYLHYLLECNDPTVIDLDVVNHDILSRDVLYYLGNFSPQQARDVVERLTDQARFSLPGDLVEALIADITTVGGRVRPIELQVVGAQIQAEQIGSLAAYRGGWNPDQLVKKYITDIVGDCGPEHQDLAWNILGLLIDPKRDLRPIRSRSFLVEKLDGSGEVLDLVLRILHESQLLFCHDSSEVGEVNYQLIHDYLVEPIREILGGDVAARLARVEAERDALRRANAILKDANDQAVVINRKANRRLQVGTGVLFVTLAVSVGLSMYAMTKQSLADRAILRAQDAESKANLAQSQAEQADQEKLHAFTEREQAQRDAGIAKQQEQLAIEQQREARADAMKARQLAGQERQRAEQIARERVAAANVEVLWAQARATAARLESERAIRAVAAAEQELATAQESRDQARSEADKMRLGSELERLGTRALKVAESRQITGLLEAMDAGRRLQGLVVGGRSWEDYPAVSPLLTLNNILTQTRNQVLLLNDSASFELSGGSAVAISPDGQTLITASDDGTARLWSRQGEELTVLQGHEARIRSAQFSPNGQTLITASDDGTARLWSRQGEELTVLRGHEARIRSVQFSPNGQTLMTTSDDGTARLWSRQGEVLAVFRGHRGVVRSAQFSPDSQTLVTVSDDATARLWSSQGEALAILRIDGSWVMSAQFSPDGQTLVTASLDGTVRLWNQQGEELAILRGHEDGVMSAQFSLDGQTLVTASLDRTVRLWNQQGEELAILRGHEDGVMSAQFSLNSQTLITASDDGTARLWSRQGKELTVLRGYEGRVISAQFSPDGQTLITVDDETARLWSLQREEFTVLRGYEGWVISAQFSPDGQTLVTSLDDRTVRLWNRRGEELAVLRGHEGWVNSVQFSPDGQTLVIASSDGTARLWNRQGEELTVPLGHEGWVRSAQFSPDGQTLVTASDDGIARLWNRRGEVLTVLRGHQARVNTAQFSPDGQTLVTASDDGTARLWNRQGKELTVLRGHKDGVLSAQFSPDGQTLVTASLDRTARLWNRQGEELTVLQDHEDRVLSAQFSPDGQTLITATASDNGTVRWWTIKGYELATFDPKSAVRAATFSPDGQMIITVDRTGKIRKWPVYSLDQLLDQLLDEACHWLRHYLRANPNRNIGSDGQPLCPQSP